MSTFGVRFRDTSVPSCRAISVRCRSIPVVAVWCPSGRQWVRRTAVIELLNSVLLVQSYAREHHSQTPCYHLGTLSDRPCAWERCGSRCSESERSGRLFGQGSQWAIHAGTPVNFHLRVCCFRAITVPRRRCLVTVICLGSKTRPRCTVGR
ncbi:hypothetical protein DAEQUDRAFT_584498 [Daedalea quercina L-15889]|uniref:Uncharacterized protein n=1 Tax=Daedalea quercina L-15889 TaxID=1314783 RepID=A0A165LQE7_9APHY|nr:hypothetical protein DAEQUDRAFT_584498 [Daedalea quercina L-15889]